VTLAAASILPVQRDWLGLVGRGLFITLIIAVGCVMIANPQVVARRLRPPTSLWSTRSDLYVRLLGWCIVIFCAMLLIVSQITNP
jgi:high-affinity nickel permease